MLRKHKSKTIDVHFYKLKTISWTLCCFINHVCSLSMLFFCSVIRYLTEIVLPLGLNLHRRLLESMFHSLRKLPKLILQQDNRKEFKKLCYINKRNMPSAQQRKWWPMWGKCLLLDGTEYSLNLTVSSVLLSMYWG